VIDQDNPAKVGRTNRADVVVPEDPHLSGVHFCIHFFGDRVLIQDLKSRNGTFVNGAKIDSVQLEDGDIIVAGRTRFQVDIVPALPGEGIQPEYYPESSATNGAVPSYLSDRFEFDRTESIPPSENPLLSPKTEAPEEPNYQRLSSHSLRAYRRHAGLGSEHPDDKRRKQQQPIPQASFQSAIQMRYETRKAPSGMTYFCPRSEVNVPIDVAEFIGKSRNLYGVLNFTRLLPQDQSRVYHEAIHAGAVPLSQSQLLVERRNMGAFYNIMKAAWGRDAVICIGSQLNQTDFADLISRWLNELQSPALLLNYLYSDTHITSYGFLEGISALLMEIEHGSRWIIFKNDSEIRSWKTLGLPCPPELIG